MENRKERGTCTVALTLNTAFDFLKLKLSKEKERRFKSMTSNMIMKGCH